MTVADYPDYATPQAHATAIAGTGAPLLNLHNQTVTNTNAHMSAGAQDVLGPFAINQPGNLWRINAFVVGAGAIAPMTVDFTWIDNATGFFTRTVRRSFWCGATTGTHVITGFGRCYGDRVKIAITNNASTAPVSYDFQMWQTSVPYAADRVNSRIFTSTSSGNGIPQKDLDGGIMAANAFVAIGAGAAVTDDIALYQGRVKLHWATGSGAADCTVNVFADGDLTVSGQGQQVFFGTTGGNGHGFTELELPGSQCQITLKNNNAGAQNMNYLIAAMDL